MRIATANAPTDRAFSGFGFETDLFVEFARVFPASGMSDSSAPPSREMIVRIAAQLMILYDDAMSEGRKEAAEAYAMALNVVRSETDGVTISFNGPPPTLRGIPTKAFPDDLAERLAPPHRPIDWDGE